MVRFSNQRSFVAGWHTSHAPSVVQLFQRIKRVQSQLQRAEIGRDELPRVTAEFPAQALRNMRAPCSLQLAAHACVRAWRTARVVAHVKRAYSCSLRNSKSVLPTRYGVSGNVRERSGAIYSERKSITPLVKGKEEVHLPAWR